MKKHSLEAEIILEEPPSGFGELATPICFDLASVLKKSPKDIAEEFTLAADISKASFIRAVKAVNGYLNFYLDYEKFTPILIKELRALDKDYGRMKKKEKVILEHTSANPDGALHIGHGRNAVIGDTLARIMRFAGYDVETQFYVNDMGKQLAIVVFGLRKLKLDRSKKKDHAIAEVYAKANSMLEEDASCEEEISKLLRDYEDGDEGVKKEFEDASGYCLEGIKETLGRMGVTYDSFVWESRFVRDLSVKKILDRLKKVKYAKSEEVLYLDLKSFGIDKELILTRKDGTYLYTTRDIAYHIWKSEKGMVIDVLGADHKLVAKQLQAVM
ncbi:MAG: arginine--tRNA ligase, partial [Candidatus Hydrothermarchaeales archaeon]